MRLSIGFVVLGALSRAGGVVNTDLISSLKGVSGRFTFTYPGLANYLAAVSPFNLRYSYQPAAVAYVNSFQQVSEVVKIGYDLGCKVAARAGGHSYVAGSLGGKGGSVVVDLNGVQATGTSQNGAVAHVTTGFKLGPSLVIFGINVARYLMERGPTSGGVSLLNLYS